MASLIDTLESSDGASGIWNEFEITVTPNEWLADSTGTILTGWIVQVRDFTTATDWDGRKRGLRPDIVRDHRVTSWDDLAGLLAELGVPAEFEGWR